MKTKTLSTKEVPPVTNATRAEIKSLASLSKYRVLFHVAPSSWLAVSFIVYSRHPDILSTENHVENVIPLKQVYKFYISKCSSMMLESLIQSDSHPKYFLW